jgi:hypothetical protein
MQRSTTQAGAAPDANPPLSEPPEVTNGGDANRDDTTLSFDGAMRVSADEGGGDPYNRTGSFKRLVR